MVRPGDHTPMRCRTVLSSFIGSRMGALKQYDS